MFHGLECLIPECYVYMSLSACMHNQLLFILIQVFFCFRLISLLKIISEQVARHATFKNEVCFRSPIPSVSRYFFRTFIAMKFKIRTFFKKIDHQLNLLQNTTLLHEIQPIPACSIFFGFDM